jgi:queuine tRNA-ribosyltransferase
LVEGVARGIDMFDCALPTRVARNGAMFTPDGRIDVTKKRYSEQHGPVDEECDCHACANYSAAYVHHLFRAREILGLRLASAHNLRFVLRLMERIREAILENRFEAFSSKFLARYQPTNEAARQEQKLRWLRERK